MERYKGYLDGEGGEAECVVETSPRGGWNIDEVTPSDLPEGTYELMCNDGVRETGQAQLPSDLLFRLRQAAPSLATVIC